MSCSKPMYQPEKCDGQFCPGDCDCGCPLAKYWLEDEEDEEKALPEGSATKTTYIVNENRGEINGHMES